jgi:hypothetical protein
MASGFSALDVALHGRVSQDCVSILRKSGAVAPCKEPRGLVGKWVQLNPGMPRQGRLLAYHSRSDEYEIAFFRRLTVQQAALAAAKGGSELTTEQQDSAASSAAAAAGVGEAAGR